jgi:methionine S-methyltransferase
MNTKIASFLAVCKKSSAAAYQAFVSLLADLDCLESRSASRQFLSELYLVVGQHAEQYHFQFIEQTILDYQEQPQQLLLLQFPSTFLPEAWSFTFYEGLIRYPDIEYRQKNIVELGCGIGWISIALAIRYGTENMVGLDINPKAITCAKLNLYLNGLDQHGCPIYYQSDQALIDMVSFQESNLLQAFDGRNQYFDKIIGCIPQVLNPEPEVMEELIADSSSDEYLQSLSNYTTLQGYVEDQFGLGLIAKAVEQSVSLLKSSGKMILNLGGRPGRSVLERLMRRRGFQVRRVWQTMVEQAADTDIDALVAIELSTDHRFEFYMSSEAPTPIDARTAHAFAQAGGTIHHSVDVYEAAMILPEQTKAIYQTINQIESDKIRSAVDLTFDNPSDAEERFGFLAALTKWMKKANQFPYESTAGIQRFRALVAEFFSYYHKISLNSEQILITPGRKELVENLFKTYQPSVALVAKSLRHLITPTLCQDSDILEVPQQIDYTTTLIKALKPKIVITQLDHFEIESRHHVNRLIESSVEHHVLLVIDISPYVELSSQPKSNGLLRYLSQQSLPGNVMITAALLNNHVYNDYTLNIAFTTNSVLRSTLIKAAELTYSRTPIMVQRYYQNLLEELLFFQRTRRVDAIDYQPVTSDSNAFILSDSAADAFSQPAIVGNLRQFTAETIRLDYGENELSAPKLLKECLLESFLVRRFSKEDSNPDDAIRSILSERFNISTSLYARMLLADGVAPLFHAVLKQCKQEQATLLLPTGGYGYFQTAATFNQVKTQVIETSEAHQFKIDAHDLHKHLAQIDQAYIYLNAPIVNPTGAIYTTEELAAIFAVAAQHHATIVMDSIFAGLAFDDNQHCDLSKALVAIMQETKARFVLLGGISKEYAAGGLRFGYAWSPNRRFAELIQSHIHRRCHFTLSYAMRTLFQAHHAQEPSLTAHLQQQIQTLKDRSVRLSEQLQRLNWQVIEPKGGLFMVAKPPINNEALSLTEQANTVADQWFAQYGIAINNAQWTGLPGYCRFVLSCSDQTFETAMTKIKSMPID